MKNVSQQLSSMTDHCSIHEIRIVIHSSYGEARTSRIGPLSVPAVPLYIQEKIDPSALVESLRSHHRAGAR